MCSGYPNSVNTILGHMVVENLLLELFWSGLNFFLCGHYFFLKQEQTNKQTVISKQAAAFFLN